MVAYSQPAVVGVLGCMAERLKTKLLEQERLVDLVVGPDAYRSLPSLVQGLQQVLCLLSFREQQERACRHGRTMHGSDTRPSTCSFRWMRPMRTSHR